MANYTQLLAAIRAAIKQNGTNDITGQLLQDTLCALVGSVGRYAQLAGVAIPNTNPGTPDQNVFYLTSTPGTYVNFGGLIVPANRLCALHNISGSWEMIVLVVFADGSTINIDPALDPDSVNPVENRAVYDECQAIRALIQSGTFAPQVFQTTDPTAVNGFYFANKLILSFNALLYSPADNDYSQYFFAAESGTRLNLCYASLDSHSVFYEHLDGATDFSSLMGQMTLVGSIEAVYVDAVV